MLFSLTHFKNQCTFKILYLLNYKIRLFLYSTWVEKPLGLDSKYEAGGYCSSGSNLGSGMKSKPQSLSSYLPPATSAHLPLLPFPVTSVLSSAGGRWQGGAGTGGCAGGWGAGITEGRCRRVQAQGEAGTMGEMLQGKWQGGEWWESQATRGTGQAT